jgi:hypothetical protein
LFIKRPKGVHGRLFLSAMDTTARGGPYHLINASLNRFDSRFGYLVERLDRRRASRDPDSRSTRNFLFSQLYCGSEVTKFCPTERYEASTRDPISLADAIAISGAAVEPMQFEFAPLAWIMTLLNIRLGQWLPNPRNGIPRWTARRLGVRVITLLIDLMRPVEDRDFCFVSDGGFTENLGIVPLLKRRCQLIVALDAGCDPKHQLSDLARVIRYASLKEGIQITALPKAGANADKSCDDMPEFSASGLRLKKGMCDDHVLVARIVYPAIPDDPLRSTCKEGTLIYIKPSLSGDERIDLLEYRKRDPDFPHDSTADQLYDDVRVESYRQLGLRLGRIAVSMLPKGSNGEPFGRDLSPEPFCEPPRPKDAPGDTVAAEPPPDGHDAESTPVVPHVPFKATSTQTT